MLLSPPSHPEPGTVDPQAAPQCCWRQSRTSLALALMSAPTSIGAMPMKTIFTGSRSSISIVKDRVKTSP